MTEMEQISLICKKGRKLKRITLSDLADMTGRSVGALSEFENAKYYNFSAVCDLAADYCAMVLYPVETQQIRELIRRCKDNGN